MKYVVVNHLLMGLDDRHSKDLDLVIRETKITSPYMGLVRTYKGVDINRLGIGKGTGILEVLPLKHGNFLNMDYILVYEGRNAAGWIKVNEQNVCFIVENLVAEIYESGRMDLASWDFKYPEVEYLLAYAMYYHPLVGFVERVRESLTWKNNENKDIDLERVEEFVKGLLREDKKPKSHLYLHHWKESRKTTTNSSSFI